jgi:Tol biopolymer transport system component
MHSRILLAAAAAVSIASCGGAAVPSAPPSGTPPPITRASSAPTPSLAPSASATPRALTGTIAFGREDRPDHWQIWRACADLSNPEQLTLGPGPQSGWPVFSPDGTRIAFNSDRDDPDLARDPAIWDIYTMDSSGGDVRKLTHAIGSAVDPAYSSDGKWIAYGWDAPGKEGIYVMSAADGGDVRRITTRPADAQGDIGPHFSPDGNRLVFTRVVNDRSAALYVVNLDGSGLARITPSSINAQEASWSHNGTRIAVYAESRGFPHESVWTMAPDGAGLTNLNTVATTPGAQDGFSDAVWAPDDSLIMVEHGLYFDGGTSTVGLATMNPDGTDVRYVGDGKGAEEKGDWSQATC